MKKICIVDFPFNGYLDGVQGITLLNIRRKPSIVERILMKLPFGKRVFLMTEKKGWSKQCIGYDVIILFDTCRDYAKYAVEIENTVGVNVRLVTYLWNPLRYSDDIKKLSSRWEQWSFSKADCKAAGMKYAETFYNPALVIESEQPERDVYFIGIDKGRRAILEQWNSKLREMGLKVLIQLVNNQKAIWNRHYSHSKSYKQVCEEVAKSKCLLEIVQEGQTGLSQRTMETLFFNKKMITNNASIMSYKFYSQDRFFVIGVDSIDRLQSFMRSSCKPLDEAVLQSFTFDNWLERIEKNIEFNIQ